MEDNEEFGIIDFIDQFGSPSQDPNLFHQFDGHLPHIPKTDRDGEIRTEYFLQDSCSATSTEGLGGTPDPRDYNGTSLGQCRLFF